VSHFGLTPQSKLAEAQQAMHAGDLPRAATILKPLVKQQKNNPQVLGMMGSVQTGLGNLTEAKRNLEKALKLRPDEQGLWYELSRVHRRARRLDDSHRCLERALKIAPHDPSCRAALSENLYLKGEYEAAYEALTPLLGNGSPPLMVAMSLARVAPRVNRRSEAIEALERAIEATPANAKIVRADATFRLASLYDGEKRYDRAFECYERANVLKGMEFDADAHDRAVDRIIEAWRPDVHKGLPRSSSESEAPIFILGMPRSGTSLVEQILGAHPRVYGAGELNSVFALARELGAQHANGLPMLTDPSIITRQALDRAARAYLGQFRKQLSWAMRVTDKMPMNFLYMGLIALLLPRSRIIHCIRDARDTCLSCYFQHFSGHNPFAYDLYAAGRFHRAYERLVEHWKGVIDVPVLDVVYEELVADQEGGSRRIVEFAGLEWDDACLRFYESKRDVVTSSSEQVRRPVYKSSVARHEHYAAHLGPLHEGLGLTGAPSAGGASEGGSAP